MSEWYGLAAGLVGIAGYAPYVHDILRRRTRPDCVSWLIWTVEYGGLFLAQLHHGADSSLWLIGLQLAGVMIIFGLSLRFGMVVFNRYNVLLLCGVAGSLALWFFIGSADVAIFLLISVEASGVVLTAVKTYRHPESETLALWWLAAAAGAIAVAGLGRNAAAMKYVYPVALIAMGLCVVSAAKLGKRRRRRASELQTPEPFVETTPE